MGNFDIISSLAIIVLAGLIHASFQTSASVLTLLSGHALSSKTAHLRLLRLTGSFIIGTITFSILLLSSLAFLLTNLFPTSTPLIIWAISSGAVAGVGLSVWLFYYRRQQGTVLWLPRSFATYLRSRAKSTKQPAEAFTLGMTSTMSELLFLLAPLVITALVLIRLEPTLQLLGVALYAIIASLPLAIIYILIGGGHTIARIQRWRENNKRFLQFAAGSGLIILGLFVYIERVITYSVRSGGFGA